ncbi:MAG: hypothetical protein IJA27_05820 [Lachnospiraceae bacterium]|nr:hypothetical protein [Lachnospiraceae bacterium]
MNARITWKEIFTIFLVIISFTVTGILIKNENYDYALISLCVVAFCVLIAFMAVLAGEDDKILDLNNPSLRNPRKSNSNRNVRYISRLTPDMAGGKKKKAGKDSQGSAYDDIPSMDFGSGGDFYESVGNMRVYRRDEEIEMAQDEDED